VAADGKSLIRPILQAHKLVDRKSTLVWPEQGIPSRSDWIIWGDSIQTLAKGDKLLQPLDMARYQSHQTWSWFMDSTQLLYNKQEDYWVRYAPMSHRTNRQQKKLYRHSQGTNSPPPLPPIYRASIIKKSQSLIEAVTSCEALPEPSPQMEHTPSQVLPAKAQLLAYHPFYSYLTCGMSLSLGQVEQMQLALHQKSLLACCDGSYDPISNASAFGMVFGTEHHPIVRSSGPCPRHPYHRSALRAELSGLIASTYLLLSLCRSGSIKEGSVILYNDCAKAHKLINKPGRKFMRFLVDEYDLITEVHQNIHDLSSYVSFQLVWVKSHYTGKDRGIQHDLNDSAHDLAVAGLSLHGQSTSDIAPPSSLVELCSDHILSSKWQKMVQEAAHSEPLRQTICKRLSWTEDQFDMVNWRALKTCLSRMPRTQHLLYSKLLHGLLNTNAQNCKYYKTSDLCPHCGLVSETFIHMASCTHPDISTQQYVDQDILWKTLKSLKTPPIVFSRLRLGIQQHSSIPPDVSSWESTATTSTSSQSANLGTLGEAIQQQSIDIEWDKFLCGKMSNMWKEACYEESMGMQQ